MTTSSSIPCSQQSETPNPVDDTVDAGVYAEVTSDIRFGFTEISAQLDDFMRGIEQTNARVQEMPSVSDGDKQDLKELYRSAQEAAKTPNHASIKGCRERILKIATATNTTRGLAQSLAVLDSCRDSLMDRSIVSTESAMTDKS